MSDEKKFSRTHFLINSKLQLSLVFYFLVIGVAVAIGIYFLLSRGFQGYIDEAAAGLPGLNKDTVPDVLRDLKDSLLRDFLVASLSGLIGTFLGGILVSHRIAGPLYRMEQAMRNYLNTGTPDEVHLRKHDYGKDMADLYNQILRKANK